jgi:hypothetical protein
MEPLIEGREKEDKNSIRERSVCIIKESFYAFTPLNQNH